MSDSALLAAYNSQVNLIRSLHALTLVEGTSGTEYGAGDKPREVGAIIDFERPDSIRMTGALSSMSSRGFEMASDGHLFRLLVPENGRRTFIVGPVDAAAHSKKPRENLRPQPLIDALRWEEAKPGMAPAQAEAEGTVRTLEVDLPPRRGGTRTGKIEFNLAFGVVNSLTSYDASGKMISTVTYTEWRPMSVYPEGTSTGCYPHRIHLVQAAGNYELRIRINEIALNPDTPGAIFRPSAPKGIPVVNIDTSGEPVRH